jgi:hypothetical protein
MKIASTLIIAGVCLFTVSCGSSDNNSNNNGGNVGGHAAVGGSASVGGHASAGGSAHVGGNASTGGNAGTSTGTCDIPACLKTFGSTCVPSGTCVSQVDMQTYTSNTCYSNGVKFITAVDLTNGAFTLTVKNGSSVCYSMSVTDANTGAMTLKDASGTAVATISSDTAGNEVVTCTGQQPVVLDSSCSNESPVGTTNTTECTQGTCVP